MSPTSHRTNVIVAMSGGVDSSVAASRLLEQGYSVTGLFMKNWEEDDESGGCPASVDLADAQSVCDRLGIGLHAVNFAAEYWERVFERMLDSLSRGDTPNPDILCNREIKFGEFIDWARELGADLVATGHYARRDDSGTKLLRARDPEKDQSYFLHAIDGSVLPRVLFPLGEMRKSEVRARARELGLATHDKRDSTGICFIGERRFRDFISRYVDLHPGDIVDTTGAVIGTHHGLAAYTLGQRHGLGIGGGGDPWYVAGKDQERNRLIAVQGHDHPLLFGDVAEITATSWIARRAPEVPFACTARTRYRQRDQACTVEQIDGDRALVRFRQPQRALTPGQSVVIYDGEACLGGGVITSTAYSPPTAGEQQPRELASA